jgi:hypothetical protein
MQAAAKRHTKHIGIFSRSLGRKLQVQAVGPLLESEFGIAAYQGDRLHGFATCRLRERVNYGLSICRPRKSDCIK